MVWTLQGSGNLVTATWTGPALLQAIKSAWNSAFSMTAYDEILGASSVDSVIYEVPSGTGKTYSTTYFRFGVAYSSTPTLRESALTAFNAATDTATNESSIASSSGLSTTTTLLYRCYSGPEGRIMLIHPSANANVFYLGWIRPQTLPTGWDENVAPGTLGLRPGLGGASQLELSSNGLLSPANARYRSGVHGLLYPSYLHAANLSGTRDIITPVYFGIGTDAVATACLGAPLLDLGFGAGTGLTLLDTVTASGQTWLLIERGGSTTAPSLFMRIS